MYKNTPDLAKFNLHANCREPIRIWTYRKSAQTSKY